jgi:RNA polymerase sigma factor (TIGR02999 family)
MAKRQDITRLIVDIRQGNASASDELFRRVYTELRRIAGRQMRNERPGHTLQPTALVHEAYMRLIAQRHLPGENRAHFFGVAANVMRRILIDHARGRHANKRGGRDVKVPLEDASAVASENPEGLLEVDRALEQLAARDPRQARIIELRFFGGLSVEETAEALGVNARTIDRDWKAARDWLRRHLSGAAEDAATPGGN